MGYPAPTSGHREFDTIECQLICGLYYNNPSCYLYPLAKSADVTLHIYSVNGTLVRTLALGHRPAGMYHNKSRAAYWDGRNELGEAVASGVYVYTLTAGDFTATRKMSIRK
ncbi:T9SS type A sorting domain-containing protein [Candidatus Poribacteria bacterium]|nr:T9SS type A sorting domain-containing protein [Candidatus Poribacteria bacterium]MYK21557.1 T9SS type A sorting domain-containing protein [Candidatus Poribacteria bacterium]